MVGGKLRNAKRVLVVGADREMRIGCPSCCRASDAQSSPRRMSRSATAIQTQQEYRPYFSLNACNEKWHISRAPETSQDHGRYSDRSSQGLV
jgi:hypothetical protein